MLLEAWRGFEMEHGDEESQRTVANLLPKRVKKRRRIETQDGVRICISNRNLFKYLKNLTFLLLLIE